MGNNAMPQSPGGASMVDKLSIPDGVHTLSQQCMQRCGVTQQYYESFKCPTKLPFQQKLLKSPAPSGCLCATNSRSEPYSASRDRLFGCIHTSCLADAQLCTFWAIDRSCTVLMCVASVE